jgi:hypothetical protein
MGEDERQIGLQNGAWRLAQTFPSFQTSHLVVARSSYLIETNSSLDRGNCRTSPLFCHF